MNERTCHDRSSVTFFEKGHTTTCCVRSPGRKCRSLCPSQGSPSTHLQCCCLQLATTQQREKTIEKQKEIAMGNSGNSLAKALEIWRAVSLVFPRETRRFRKNHPRGGSRVKQNRAFPFPGCFLRPYPANVPSTCVSFAICPPQ